MSRHLPIEQKFSRYEPITNRRSNFSRVLHSPSVRFAEATKALRYRPFRVLWIGVLISASGQWMEQFAVAWLMYELTDSAFMVAAGFGVRSLPSLALSMYGGVIADRFDRRRIIAFSQAGTAILATVMAVLNFTGVIEPWHVYSLVFLFGVSWAFNNPARHALMPSLVPRKDLMNAISVNSTAFNVSRVLGPAMGGILIATVDVWGTFALAAVLYVAVYISTHFIEVPPRVVTAVQHSVRDNFKVGFRYLKQDRTVMTIILLAFIPTTMGMPYVPLLTVFVGDVLTRGPGFLSVIFIFTGIGSMLATIVLASMGNYRGAGKMIFGLGFVFGLSVLCLGVSRNVGLVLLYATLAGGAFMAYMAVTMTLIQTIVPDNVRGRVTSIMMMEFGLTPAGALIFGAIAEVLSVATAYMIMGSIVATCFGLGFVVIRNIRRLDPGSYIADSDAPPLMEEEAPSNDAVGREDKPG